MRIIFAGTPEFAADHLRAIATTEHKIVTVITQPDKPGKRGRGTLPSPVKKVAEELKINVLQPRKLNVKNLVGLSPDLMVVVAYGQILQQPVLDLPKFGCINVHASLLPRWRGAAPIQRAILAGDQTTGVCIMKMDVGLDTGDVIQTTTVPIDTDDNSSDLTQKLSRAGTKALLEVLRHPDFQTLKAEPQATSGITYAHKITKSEAQIDWDLPASQLALQVRAFNPDPIAFSHIDDVRIKLWHAEAIQSSQSDASSGTILAVTKSGIQVQCGSGVLLISAIQLPIGKGSVLSGSDVLNARSTILTPGKTFRFHTGPKAIDA